MKIYSPKEAVADFERVLESARKEPIVIRSDGGEEFQLVLRASLTSPLDIPSIRTRATTGDILSSLREFRARSGSNPE